MATTRSSLTRGPGYLTLNSSTTPSTTSHTIQFGDDWKLEIAPVNEILKVAHIGNADETRKDLIVRGSGQPLIYNATDTTTLDFLFPWANQNPPLIGASLFGSSDFPVIFLANNNDEYVIYNAAVAKMPDITLDIGKPILGPLEIIGLIRNGYDPETANSYYKVNPGAGSWASPKLGQQSGDMFGRQRYYGNWAAVSTLLSTTTFTNFQGQQGITISHELGLEPVIVQGRTVDFTLLSYRAMAKLIFVPGTGSTTGQADIDACLQAQGTGATHGSRLSSNTNIGDVVFTGQIGGTFTIKNAVLKSEGFVFGGKPLRYGEIGFVGTFNYTGSPVVGGLLAS